MNIAPCKYCGSECKLEQVCFALGKFGRLWLVRCPNCWAAGPVAKSPTFLNDRGSHTLAVLKWNKIHGIVRSTIEASEAAK